MSDAIEKVSVEHGLATLSESGEQLPNAPIQQTLIGKRDRAILAMLTGCGLRRGKLGHPLLVGGW